MYSNIDSFEQKKVQEVKGSFYIYLPKEWCKKYQIGQQKRIFLKTLEDDTILIRNNGQSVNDANSYSINLDHVESNPKISKEEYYDYIFNLYLTAYIIGYKQITFEKRTKIPMQLQNRITEMTRKLHGMVIISETINKVVVEDTTGQFDLKILIRQLLNKVGLLITNYIELVDDMVDNGDLNSELDELIKQDDQIDELRYAIERAVHLILKYPTMGHDLGITTIECLHYSEEVRKIERVGDYVTKLAILLQTVKLHDREFILSHLRNMEQVYNLVQDNFERTDTLRFFHLIQEIKIYADNTKRIINEGNKDKNYLVAIRRVQNICSDISEIRINDILSREQSANGKKKKKFVK